MIEEKKCVGTGKAKGYGCKDLVPVVLYGEANRIYGLGKSCGCYKNWLINSDEGQKTIAKASLRGKKIVEKQSKKEEREKTAQQKIELMSVDKYRAKFFQPLINKIARLIDYGMSCIATDNFGKMNGGHYRSIGSNRTIAFNLHNIHIQSFESNTFRGGDDKNYKDGLIDRYGLKYFDFVDALRQHRALKLSKDEMAVLKEKASEIIKRLNSDNESRTIGDVIDVRNPEERIKLRNQVNLELGIYDEEYCEFKT